MEKKQHLRKKVSIKLIHVIATIIIVIGGLMLWSELKESVEIKSARNIGKIKLETLKKGDYVTGDINTLLGEYVQTLGEDSFSGQSIGYTSLFLQSSNFYTIPIGDGTQYMTLLLSDKEGKMFEKMTDIPQEGITVAIVGKIVKLPTEINYEWMKTALKVNTNQEINKMVSPLYGIKLVDKEAVQNAWKKGLSILFTGILLLTLFGNLDKVVSMVEETPAPVLSYENRKEHLNPEMVAVVIAGKRKERENLKHQYGQYERLFLIYLILSIVMVYYSFQIYYFLIWLAAAVVVFLCAKNLWNIFINGRWKTGRKIARIFDIDSITDRIDIIDAQINTLIYLNMEQNKTNE